MSILAKLQSWFRNRPAKMRKPARRSQLLLEQLERREVMSGTTFHLDLGTSISPVASGYQHVSRVKYTAARGFGWETTKGLEAVNRGPVADTLVRDFHRGAGGTFL